MKKVKSHPFHLFVYGGPGWCVNSLLSTLIISWVVVNESHPQVTEPKHPSDRIKGPQTFETSLCPRIILTYIYFLNSFNLLRLPPHDQNDSTSTTTFLPPPVRYLLRRVAWEFPKDLLGIYWLKPKKS